MEGDIPLDRAPKAPAIVDCVIRLEQELADNMWAYIGEHDDKHRWRLWRNEFPTVFAELNWVRGIVNIWMITPDEVPFMTMDLWYHADPVSVFNHLVGNVIRR